MQTPIAFFVFNRPDVTQKVFEVIREAKPQKLLLIADGPRVDYPSDVKRCQQVRKIIDQVDWACDVQRSYSDSNLGLKQRVSSGLNWVFEQVERAVILEDDCLPHPDFFEFCENLLNYYQNDERVWIITGDNFQNGHLRGNASYYFSKYNHCWGWATWRRAWKYYQGDIHFWPEWKLSADWKSKVPNLVERGYWTKIFNEVHAGKINSWAYPWTASVWYHAGLTVTPNVNLVKNIGFGEDATHTKKGDNTLDVPIESLGELIHPRIIAQNENADNYVFQNHFGGRYLGVSGFPRRIIRKLVSLRETASQ